MHEFVQPEGWAAPKGYANGILSRGRTLHIGGQIGWTGEGRFDARDFVGQTRQALLNIRTVLEAAGATPAHLTRLTWYVTSKAEYLAHQREVGEAYREVLGRHFPAMTMVIVAGLIEDEALVEIEATAVMPD